MTSTPRNFPIRGEDQQAAGGGHSQGVRWHRSATLADVVTEIRLLREDLESRTLAGRCRRVWQWCAVQCGRIVDLLRWS